MWVEHVEKIDAKPIFTAQTMISNLAMMYGTVKISVALGFFLIEQQHMTLCVVIYHRCKPPVQFWWETLVRTLILDKNL